MDEPREPEAPERSPAARGISPGARLAIELGPLLVFFFTLLKLGIFVATGVFMVAIVIALACSWHLERRLPPMALVTGVLVVVLGGLTLWLGDETFIKLKPTIVSLLFAAVLAAGLFLKKPFLQVVMGQALELTEQGWRVLTVRWIGFFVALAVLNELARRNLSTEAWATFKVFGVLGLTFLFTLSQLPLINRHRPAEEPD